jgi:hypothetical protein
LNQPSDQGPAHAHVLVKNSAATAQIVPSLAFSSLSRSSRFSESGPFITGLSDSPFSSSVSPEKEGEDDSNINDLLAGLCSSESIGPDAMMDSVTGHSQPWPTPSLEIPEYGFEVFGSSDPSGAFVQSTELKFTELMLKIRDVGFVDMESSKPHSPKTTYLQ